MTVTIGLVANIFQEANALPGWLESATQFADHVAIYHSGPCGTKSNDGTIEILEKWKIPVVYGSIDEGFGVIRTKTINMSPCDYVMLLDADERFHHLSQVMTCDGPSTPPDEANTILQSYDCRDLATMIPNWENVGKLGANCSVSFGEAYNQGAWLRSLIEDGTYDAVMTVRRHWHDFSRKRPTQNWHTDPDWQMRIVRNDPSIYFAPETRMHERLQGANNVFRPNFTHGPFFDHYHFSFKRMQQEQRSHNIAVYDAISDGRRPPTLEEFKVGIR